MSVINIKMLLTFRRSLIFSAVVWFSPQ